MSMENIRHYYGVPAQEQGRVSYTGSGQPQPGTIIAADGARLRIQLDGQEFVGIYHPTWEITYIEGESANG